MKTNASRELALIEKGAIHPVTAFQIRYIISPISTSTKSDKLEQQQQQRSMPPRTPFSPSIRRTGLSNHPKTVLNRRCEANKDPLERAFGRDDATFRKAKSRHLTAFRSSKEWNRLSQRDREKAEQEIVDSLIAVRDAKKREHQMEWRRKVEANEEEEADPDEADPDEDEHKDADKLEANDDGDSEWMSEDSEDSDTDGDNDEEVVQDLARSVSQIKRLWGEGYWRQVADVERVAREKEAEYKEYLESHQ